MCLSFCASNNKRKRVAMRTYYSKHSDEKLAEIGCNICGSRDFEDYFVVEESRFVKCRRCGLVYQNPQPIFSDLKNRYNEEYFRYELENEENFFNLMLLGLNDISFWSITANFREREFLDIGCATGMLISYMEKKGWKGRGVEICRESAEYGIKKRGVDIFIGTLEEASFPDNSFSVVHFSHLIEHLTDPRSFMLEVHRIVRGNGYVIVTTPNIDGLQAKIFGTEWRSAIPDHLFLFSKKTLQRLVEETGFEVVKIVTWGGLAKGTVPSIVKKPVDKLAKLLGFGDVMLFLLRKL